VILFQRLILRSALRHDSMATSLAKTIDNNPPARCTSSFPVLDATKGKENIFYCPEGGDETELLSLYPRVCKTTNARRAAVLCTLVNSYRPLRQDHDRADHSGNGPRQSHHGIRVPAVRPVVAARSRTSGRMDCNSLTLASRRLWPASYLGMEDRKKSPKPATLSGDAL